MRRAMIPVSAGLLETLILPHGTKIVDAKFEKGIVMFLTESHEFEDVPEGAEIPVKIVVHETSKRRFEDVKW